MSYSPPLTDTVTYWRFDGAQFESPVLLEPGGSLGAARWRRNRHKFSNEEQRGAVSPAEMQTAFQLDRHSVVADGDKLNLDPWQADDPFEVVEVRRSDSLIGGWAVFRSIIRPLFGQLLESVTIYAVERVETSRGYRVQRGDEIYSGPASVDSTSRPQQQDPAVARRAGAEVQEFDAVVTIPRHAISTSFEVLLSCEIEWQGPYGNVMFESRGPLFNSAWSPFWLSLTAMLRMPNTPAAPLPEGDD